MQNSLLKNTIILIFLIKTIFSAVAQQSEKQYWKPNKFGVLYQNGNEGNFMFDDPDYTHTAKSIKAIATYQIASWRKFEFDGLIQTSYQVQKHQLLNEQFITPDIDDYLAKRVEFTQLKTIHFSAFELGLVIHYRLFPKTKITSILGAGAGYLDTESERVAKGFSFIENFSIGITQVVFLKTECYVGMNIQHISNLDFQSPNSGYNFVGFEIGLHYVLN